MSEPESVADALDRHAWFDGLDPLCFTLIEGVPEDEVIRRFGGDPATAELHGPSHYWELNDALGPADLIHLLQVGTADSGHVFAIEENGWTGQYVHEHLTRGGGRAITVYLHINAADRVVYSVDGRLVVDEEPWGPLTPLSDPEPDPAWNPAWCEGLTDEEHEVWLRGARLPVLAERVIGTRIDPEWFRRELRSVRLPEPDRNPMVSYAQVEGD